LGEILEGELNGVGEFVVCLRSPSDLLALADPIDRGSGSRGGIRPKDGSPGDGGPGDGSPSEVIGKIGIWRVDASSSSSSSFSPSGGGGGAGEIGFMLHRAHWRRGLMREAMQALLPYFFRPIDDGGLGLEAVTADVDPRNSASLGLLGELGFEVTGREERTIWIDGGPDGDSDGGEWVDSVYLRLGREV
jgi:RimJ/RimL family protein N-acetyltransferase